MLRYDECKNNNNKDFRSYPKMTVQVVLMKFYGGIYVFYSLTLRILMWGDLASFVMDAGIILILKPYMQQKSNKKP